MFLGMLTEWMVFRKKFSTTHVLYSVHFIVLTKHTHNNNTLTHTRAAMIKVILLGWLQVKLQRFHRYRNRNRELVVPGSDFEVSVSKCPLTIYMYPLEMV